MPDTLELEVMPANRMNQPYSPEEKIRIKQIIVQAISTGMPEAVAIRDIAELPSNWTLKAWRDDDEGFASAIAHARLLGRDAIAYELRATARGEGESTGDVQRDKLIIETDLKLLSKWDPKRYGDRVVHDVTTKTLIIKVDATLTPEDASEAYKELMG